MRTHVTIIAFLSAVLCGSALAADVGQLKYGVPKGLPDQSPDLRADWFSGDDQFVKIPADSGTVHPKAVMAQLFNQQGQRNSPKIMVAIDCTKADAKLPDVIRFDFTGKGKFDDKSAMPLKGKMQGNMFVAEFGPQTMTVTINDASVPVTVSGHYQKTNSYRYLNASIVLAAEGECSFGDKAYPVCVIDTNGNFKLGEEGKFGKRAWDGPTGDMVLVDVGQGFDKPAAAILGQPVLVGGKWYDVTFDAAALKISAKPSGFESAQIKIDHDKWSMMLAGKKYCIRLAGGKEAVALPPDTYEVRQYSEFVTVKPVPTDKDAVTGGNLVAYSYSVETVKYIEAVAGKITDVAIGSPIVARLEAKQTMGRKLQLSMSCVDVAGQNISNVSVMPKGRPDAPKFEITDESGKKVYSGSMEYG